MPALSNASTRSAAWIRPISSRTAGSPVSPRSTAIDHSAAPPSGDRAPISARSLDSMVLATRQPSFRAPTSASAGSGTSVRNTSQKWRRR